MRKNVRAAMDALFSGKEYTNVSIQTRQRGEFLIDIYPDVDAQWPSNHTMEHSGMARYLPTVYSYGSHFPLVILDGDRAYLNTKNYSVTTSTQQSGAAIYLHYEGYEPTADTLTQKGYTQFAVYRKVRPECWPGGHYSGTYDRPAHHGVQS